MWILCHYVGDMSAQSFLIVHQLVMCQNFLMLRYSMLIADGAARFFLNDGTSNIRYCYQTSYYVVRRVCTSILIVHNLRMVKNFQADRRKSYIQNIAADAQPSPLFDVQKWTKNQSKMDQNSIKNRPKSSSVELRGRFGGLLGLLGRSKGILKASWIVLEASWKRLGQKKWPTWLQPVP